MYKLHLTGPWTDGIGIGEGRKVSHYHATGSLSANPQGDMLRCNNHRKSLNINKKNKGPEKVKQLT